MQGLDNYPWEILKWNYFQQKLVSSWTILSENTKTKSGVYG